MKKLHRLFAVALVGVVAAGAVACNPLVDGSEEDGPITVDPSSLEFGAQGESKTVDVTGNNWEALPNENWIEVAKSEGKITVTVAANESEEVRVGSVTVRNSSDSKIVTVLQNGVGTIGNTLSVDPERLSFAAAGETLTVNVTSELDWTATSADGWIAIAKAEGSFTVTVGENKETAARNGSITVDNGRSSKDIAVAQTAGEPGVTVEGTLRIVFSDTGATAEPAIEGIAVALDGANVTVNSTVPDIEYELSGETGNGFLKIYSDSPFTLTLDGVSILNPAGPAINIQSKELCLVTLAGGTTNTMADVATYATSDEDQKGCFFSEGELIFDGPGALTVDAKYKHAIASDTRVRVDGGDITTTSIAKKGHSIASNGDITINGGTLSLSAGGAAAKGLNVGGNAVITGGDISINTSGDAIVEDNDTTSPSCIKADVDFVMSGGRLTVTASGAGGKAISTDGDFNLLGGDIIATTTGAEFVSGSLDTSPKAIKADGNIYIKEGTCTVTTTSEGLEAEYDITIDGGTVEITAADDAINASATGTSSVVINGGRVYAYSSANDGIDSNGTFTMTGGVVIAAGTTQPEGGIDCDQNAFLVSGGTLISTGGATSYPTSGSTQHSIVYGATGNSGDWIQVKKSSGEQVLVYRVPRSYGNQMVMLISDGGIVRSTGYTVTRGGSYTGGTESFHGYYTGGTYTGGTATTGTTSSSAAYTSFGNTGGGPRP